MVSGGLESLFGVYAGCLKKVNSGQVKSGQVNSRQVRSGRVKSEQVKSGQDK